MSGYFVLIPVPDAEQGARFIRAHGLAGTARLITDGDLRPAERRFPPGWDATPTPSGAVLVSPPGMTAEAAKAVARQIGTEWFGRCYLDGSLVSRPDSRWVLAVVDAD